MSQHYELHSKLINSVLPAKVVKNTDRHILTQNHRFLWDNQGTLTWEEQFARRYYEKLFKEYCIADLSLYKDNKVALRWRVEKEVVTGKGQFICGNKLCKKKEDLRSWEVNFSYTEQGEKKNALVKIRLCPVCSGKLNYRSRKREIKRINKKKDVNRRLNKLKTILDTKQTEQSRSDISNSVPRGSNGNDSEITESPWAKHSPVKLKSREEEMEEYLQDLLL